MAKQLKIAELVARARTTVRPYLHDQSRTHFGPDQFNDLAAAIKDLADAMGQLAALYEFQEAGHVSKVHELEEEIRKLEDVGPHDED